MISGQCSVAGSRFTADVPAYRDLNLALLLDIRTLELCILSEN